MRRTSQPAALLLLLGATGCIACSLSADLVPVSAAGSGGAHAGGGANAGGGAGAGDHGDCGDGKIDAGEACDDGDAALGDGCDGTCHEEHGYTCSGEPSQCAATCGDGVVAAGIEACDDGNPSPGDGCDGCDVEQGFQCSGEPSTCIATCGDGLIAGDEECDGDVPLGQDCVGCELVASVLINEIAYDSSPVGPDAGCYIELRGAAGASLDGYALHLHDGMTGAEYAVIGLDGKLIGSNGYFVITQDNAVAVAPGANEKKDGKADLHDAPGSVVLRYSGAVVDALGYGGVATFFGGEGAAAIGAHGPTRSLARFPDGADTGNNDADFRCGDRTPGAPNTAPLPAPATCD